MRKLLMFAVLGVALGACDSGGAVEPDPEPTVDTRPANIIITAADRTGSTLEVSFENTGGPGAFMMEIYGYNPSIPVVRPIGAPELTPEQRYPILFGDTESVEVAAGWKETGTYSGLPAGARRLEVYSRNTGSISWRHTDQQLVE